MLGRIGRVAHSGLLWCRLPRRSLPRHLWLKSKCLNMHLHHCRAKLILDDFERWRVTEGMHEAMVNRQHKILKLLVVFEILYL